jgi:hypothetical protein
MTEDLLRDAMDRFTEDVSVPSGLPARAARQLRRRRRSATAAVTASMAAVAATGVALSVGPAPGPDVHTVAYVIGRTQAALSQQTSIEHARITMSGGVRIQFGADTASGAADSWIYQHRVRFVTYGPDRQVNGDTALAINGRHSTTTTVSYRDRTWWRTDLTLPALPRPAPTPAPACAATARLIFGFLDGEPDWAAQIRVALSCGQYEIAGSQRVDGVQTIHLKPVRSSHAGLYTEFWVDPASYLPVRDVVTFQGAGSLRVDFQWLAATSANLADLDARIPSGFTQVRPPAHAGWVGIVILSRV